MKMLKRRYIRRARMKFLAVISIICIVTTLKHIFTVLKEDSKYNIVENILVSEKSKKSNDFKSHHGSTDELNPHSKPAIRMSSKKPSTHVSKCGYNKCSDIKNGFFNIHLIPHSHHDPGYKKTMDEYFYGLRNDIQNVNISKIIDNVIHQLALNKDRKFVYVEVVYFSKWWQLQTEPTKEIVRDLVQNGRFEFLNGGWCVNDEATTNYADVIDQMSLGLNFLAETFGECGRPKVAMQIDTFGHSREQALLDSLMGFDALFVGRIDSEDKNRRMYDEEMEMIWYGSDRPGTQHRIFTGITYNIFDPPPGFCFENNCGPDQKFSEPINDDVQSKGYNVDKRVNEFLEYCKWQAYAYKTDNIAIYMGSDFTYENAEIWFSNIDKLIKHTNERQKNGSLINIFYSTPTCYVKALNEANETWTTKTDDFFPHHGHEHMAFWTGYFSSRPALKYMIRQGSSLLQTCKQMASMLKLKGADNKGNVSVMKEAMALLQHHDGITGTHSQRVDEDYVRILHKGTEECTKTMNSYYQSELPRNKEAKEFKISVSYCQQLNISQCWVTEEKRDRFVVNIYNSLGQYIDKYVRVPVSQECNKTFYNFRVIDSNGEILPSHLMPIASFVVAIPGRISGTKHELVFLATKLPPLGSKSYYVEASVSIIANRSQIPVTIWNSSAPSNQLTNLKISNEKLSLAICKDTGLITSLTIIGKKRIPLNQQFYWYSGNGLNCSFDENSSSGMYVFNPAKDSAFLINTEKTKFMLYKGDLVEEIHQNVNDYIGQIIRLYKGQDYIEFDWVIGPVPIDDGNGKEIITRYSTDFANNGEFYTDTNGRQSILRIRDQRQTFKSWNGSNPIASNYYPITSHIYLNDSNSGYRMNLLTDRAQGGGSIKDGQIELLIHRRLVQDDLCLFNETLNEIFHGKGLVVRGTHTLFFENVKDVKRHVAGSSTLRSLVQERSRQPVISFISLDVTSDKWARFYRSQIGLLSQSLPENVKLLSFEPRPWYKEDYILRLEHIYDFDEHPVLSSLAQVSLKGLFKGLNIKKIEETTLDGNLKKSDLIKLNWKSNITGDEIFDYQYIPHTSLDIIKLMPMEIRTFIITILAN